MLKVATDFDISRVLLNSDVKVVIFAAKNSNEG